MKTREEILADIHEGLETGVISQADLAGFGTPLSKPAAPAVPSNKPDKLSAVDVMFYIAGFVLFAAIMSVIAQSWNDGNAFVHVLLSAGLGLGMWSLAYYLINNPVQNEVRRGLINSLLLTGALSVIVGGYIISNEITNGYEQVNYFAGSITLLVVGGLHIGFDRLIKRDLILLLGILLCVAAFPVFVIGILQNTDTSIDIWTTIIILSAGLLAYATRVVAKLKPDRHAVGSAFDGLAAFTALISMYAASFSDYGVLWQLLLIGGVFGIFYLSIVMQNKSLLGNASFFLVLTVITISFKYFSGYGVTLSLILATMGLLGSAAIASGINKKYFKQPSQAPVGPLQ